MDQIYDTLDLADQKEIYVAGPPSDKDSQIKMGILDYVPLPNSIQCECGMCGHQVWIGPKQETVAAKAREQSKDVHYVCFPCSFYLQFMFKTPEDNTDLKVARAGDEGGTYKLAPEVTNRKCMEIFTIYDHPNDVPNKFVLRRWTVKANSVPVPDAGYQTADTLDGIRALIPPGLHCMPRNPQDDPKVVESWI